MAHQYIENSLSDEAWAWNNPVISAQSKFYTDDTKKVSYIEYKVSCDSTPDCGFIMMNVDGNDVSVPIASPTGNTPSEILDQGKDVSEKLYYFGPFDLYSENEVTWDVQAINPQVAVDLRDDTQVERTKEEKEVLKTQKEELKTKLKDAKLAAKEFKKSEEFKKQKEEIKDQILNVPKEEFSMKALDFAFADEFNSTGWYSSVWPSDKFIVWSTTSDCPSKVPCYDQYQSTYTPAPVPYSTAKCWSGCSPTAVAILFGYYDRNGKWNLIPGTAPSAGAGSNSTLVTLINAIKWYIGTTCLRIWTTNIYSGASDKTKVKDAKWYAIAKWYTNTTSAYSATNTTTIFYKVKSEVDLNKPLIIHLSSTSTTEWHAAVAFWYKIGSTSIVRMNIWWWNRLVPWSTVHNYSNIDQNLNSVFYNWSSAHIATAYTSFNIQ